MLLLVLALAWPAPWMLAREPVAADPAADDGTCAPGDVLCPDGAHCCPAGTPVCCPSTQGCCPSGTRYSCWLGDDQRGCFATEEEAQARCPAVFGPCE